MKTTIYGKVKNFKPSNAKSIREAFNALEGKRYTLTIEKTKSKRSDQQNKFWWVLMEILSKDLGYTKNEIHEICKFKFLKKSKVDTNTGEILEYLGSSSELNKSEFADLISELQVWASQTFNIVLPDANEQTELYE